MAILTPDRAQTILTALNRKTPTIEETQAVFINAYGQIIVVKSEYHIEYVGKIINENTFEINGVTFLFSQPQTSGAEFPANPVAKTLLDRATGKQLGMIRALARSLGVDADEECNRLMKCRIDELSEHAATELIYHFQHSN